ncbi:uncharacterized protein BDZ99DRAFT_520173 [Mytilinidion resinicola]|uniref:F-box domain-containing protein n=1 Tax=Mytilinidion resinicola TaxID=574789 RepID=A0A6A6YMR4_9PEZI|nr:uncharacterized protein BDZ99DRAFT_520173 [Mytilinidion resinicola]KAF2810080.1 hypothetical protein BDZ99DRAFT_520173 [Mytilinidion resinicola]
MARRTRRNKRARRSFPFLRLPFDLQLSVLGSMDFQSLYDSINASPLIEGLFLKYPETILRDIIGQHPQQIQNHILTALTLNGTKILRSDNLGTFLADSLDANKSRQVLCGIDDPLAVLDELRTNQSQIGQAVHLIATATYQSAGAINNPGAILEPLILSTPERLRISRALWTLRLFDRPCLEEDPAKPFTSGLVQRRITVEEATRQFLLRLSLSEVDELTCVHRFLMARHDHLCHDVFQVSSSRYLTEQERTTSNPFRACGGNQCFFPRRALKLGYVLEPFRQALRKVLGSRHFQTSTDFGASPQIFLRHTTRVWPDWPEGSSPGSGWTYFDAVRAQHDLTRTQYWNFFQDAGIFFWDLRRLLEWGFVGRWDGPDGMKGYLKERDRQQRINHSYRERQIRHALKVDQDLINWTRCAIPCTFYEWQSQGTIVGWYSNLVATPYWSVERRESDFKVRQRNLERQYEF